MSPSTSENFRPFDSHSWEDIGNRHTDTDCPVGYKGAPWLLYENGVFSHLSPRAPGYFPARLDAARAKVHSHIVGKETGRGTPLSLPPSSMQGRSW